MNLPFNLATYRRSVMAAQHLLVVRTASAVELRMLNRNGHVVNRIPLASK